MATIDAAEADARAKAAVILGHLGGAGDVARLARALGDPATSVSDTAAKSLAQLADRKLTAEADVAEISAALRAAFAAVEQRNEGGFAQWSIIDALERFDRESLVELLTEALGSSRRDARMVAVRRLGGLGDRRAVEPLNQALSDEEWTVREDAADHLRQFADPSSIDPLLSMLARDTGLSRVAAIETLGAIGDPRAAAPMVAQLRSSSDLVREKAEDTIVALAGDDAIAALVALLGEDPPDWLAYATGDTDPPGLSALTRLGERAVRPLIEAAPGSERAVQALLRIGPVAVPALLEGLAGPGDDGPALTCAELLAALGEPGVSALGTALTDEQPKTRAAAAYGLWQARAESTIPLLVGALSDPEADVRSYAVVALGSFGEPSLIDPVAALTGDHDPEVRVCAAISLARLGDDRSLAVLRAALANGGDPARLAAQLIGYFMLSAGVEPLIGALESGSAELGVACAVALGEIGDPQALPALDKAARLGGAAAAEAARKIREY